VRGWFVGGTAAGDDEILASLPAPRAFDPEGPLRDAEVRRALALSLARLPDRQRLAILLRHFEALSVREIAAVLDTSEHAAESLIARATAALRTALAGEVEK
jgi:RNA polymerase sigma-70 factor (ECF subfamily)